MGRGGEGRRQFVKVSVRIFSPVLKSQNRNKTEGLQLNFSGLFQLNIGTTGRRHFNKLLS